MQQSEVDLKQPVENTDASTSNDSCEAFDILISSNNYIGMTFAVVDALTSN